MHEAGLAADGRLHAVQKRIGGYVALCGAGPVSSMVPGRFSDDDEQACSACAAMVRSEPG